MNAMYSGRSHLVFCALLVALPMVSCAQEDYPLSLWEQQHPAPGSDASGGEVGEGGDDGSIAARGVCRQARAQPLPGRLATMVEAADAGGAGAGSANLLYVSDLYDRFDSLCGACHGASLKFPFGNYGISSPADFTSKMSPDTLAHVTSNGPTPGLAPEDDPADPMPPFGSGGEPYVKRLQNEPNGPTVQFVSLVQDWLDAGKPASFVPAGSGGAAVGIADGGLEAPYLLPAQKANAMTNLGDCIPDESLVATETTRSVALDTMFAQAQASTDPMATPQQMIGLPEHLKDTDLVTFDTAALARYGVISFQPNYPLWSDDARELRFVRVPRGQSIRFDKDTQEFTIPANTRFYETFLKRIVDVDGSYRWRKIETRLILARPNQPNADGSFTVMALYGVYRWNGAETDAQLVETPLRDTAPFADTLLQYATDEQLAADILRANPPEPEFTLQKAGAARHYAIPSSDRCNDCHEGSPSGTFVLGFRPIQLNRRLPGEGGTLIEPGQSPPGADEMTQLQRLIEYGVVTGMASPADVLPLERSEGSRAPRNDYELIAQGYMLGNCAHCHNPNGDPSLENPVLQDLLDFMPGPNGGIFQFPLERMSPRITRGPGGSTQIPYITPSLVDQPAADWATAREAPGLSYQNSYLGKVSTNGGTDTVYWVLYAPWRSLIYRATQTPFPYADDLVIFPHMPMHTAGYDCRLQKILGDWMVSIPAMRKNPQIPEYAYFADPDTNAQQLPIISFAVDDAPQPYVEVVPGDPMYDAAKKQADERVQIFDGLSTSPDGGAMSNPAVPALYSVGMGSYCPDTSDILDPVVVQDPTCHPVPEQARPEVANGPTVPSPGRPHWVQTDLTLAPGGWQPSGDWAHVLVPDSAPLRTASCPGDKGGPAVRQDEQQVVDLLQHVTVTDAMRSYGTHSVPMGLWQMKPGCNFASQATVGSLDPQPPWIAAARKVSTVHDGDPVYSEWPGAAVFNMICVNCHGPDADGNGRIAENLLVMSGGDTRTADLRDGLFGPVGANAGANRQAVFGALPQGAGPAWTGVSVDDRAARYLPWMALGGTEANIPTAILNIVGNTQILGVHRPLPGVEASPNMLQAAKELCAELLVDHDRGIRQFDWTSGGFFQFTQSKRPPFLDNYFPLIATNGDAEVWLKLCSIDNPPPVRALAYFKNDGPNWLPLPALVNRIDNGGQNSDLFTNPLYDGTDYPPTQFSPTAPIGNQAGNVDSTFTANNVYPWCVRVPPNDTPAHRSLRAANLATLASQHLPPCPVDTSDDNGISNPLDPTATTTTCANHCWSDANIGRWATRGAINAGIAVFLYLDAVSKGITQAQPEYDQCELLQ